MLLTFLERKVRPKNFNVKGLLARVKILLERKYTPSQEHNTAVIIP